MNGLKRRPQASFPSRFSLVSRFESRKLLILMVVVIITILVDSEIGIIADFIPEQLSSSLGVAVFIAIAIIFAITQYFILAYIKQSNKENRARALHLRYNKFDSIRCTIHSSRDTCICYLADHNNTTV